MSQKNLLFFYWKYSIFLILLYFRISHNPIIFKVNQKSILHHNYFHKFYPSKHLAFNIFLKEKYTNTLNIDAAISHEIIINGIDNYILKDKLLERLDIQNINNQIISTQNIDSLITKIKLSGFFTHIDISHQILNGHQIIYITLNINPVLKSITIINLQEKLIPSEYIISLFNKQIGYPINFIEVNKNINLMQYWYHSRGYKWTDVNIHNLTYLDGNIIINISEGMINRIEVLNYHQQADFTNSLPTSLFLETLKIKPDTLLNTKKIDDGILKLKQQRVIGHCNYEIVADHDNKLNICFIVGLLDDRYTYLFTKNVSITSSLLESMDLLLQSSLNHFFYNHNGELDVFNVIYRTIYNHNYNFFNSIYFNMFDYDNQALDLLNPKKIRLWPRINEWYLTQLIFVAGDTFGFRHYIRNVGKAHSNYVIDMRFPVTGPYLNLRYDQPWTRIYKDILSHINIRFHKDTYIFHKNYIPVLLEQLNDSMFYYKNSILSDTSLNLTCKHSCNGSTQLFEYIRIKQIVSQYLLLHNLPAWNSLKFNMHSSVNPNYSYFKQIWINNIQEFFQLDMKIIFTQLYSSFKNYEAIIESNHFIPKKVRSIFYRLPINLNYNNRMRFRINAKYKFVNKFINFESELLTFTGRLEFLPYSEHFFLIGPDIVRGYKEEVFPFPLKFGKVKLEYHIQFANYQSIFVFLDYAKNMKMINGFKHYQILLSQYYLYKFNDFNIRLGYGLGIQIQTPLKQIPPLRIEYGYNIHTGNCIHLRLHKQ